MRSPDFDAARRERNRSRSPLTFTLGCPGKTCPDSTYDRSARRWTCTGAHAFTCLTHPTVADALDIAEAPEWEEDQQTALGALVHFIDHLLASEADRERFKALLARREDPLDPEAIYDVGVYLAEQYQPVPFEPSTGSSSGPRTGGRKSKKRPVHKGRVTS